MLLFFSIKIHLFSIIIVKNFYLNLKYLMNFLIYFILYFSINNKYFIFNEFRKNVFDYLIFILFIIIFL